MAVPAKAALRREKRPGSDVGQSSRRRTASPSEALQSDLWWRGGSARGKLSCVPSCSTKSLLDLLDEHGGSSRELLLWRIDLKLAPASGPAEPRSAKVGGGVDVDSTRLC